MTSTGQERIEESTGKVVQRSSAAPQRRSGLRGACTVVRRGLPREPIRSITELTPRVCSAELVERACPKCSQAPIELEQLFLLLAVSKDEEYVQLRIMQGRLALDLGARAHNYLLLTLARRRLADAAAGSSENACGWICLDDFSHDPSMGPPRLNIDVFRLRRQLASRGVANAARIVERRASTRQLRIGTGRISIATL